MEKPALSRNRLAGFRRGDEQLEILRIPRADLNDVRVYSATSSA